MDRGLLIFRILVGFALMRAHGLPKLFDKETTMEHLPDMGLGLEFSYYYAILANVICAAFIGLGLFTRVSALVIASITVTGLLFIHIGDPAKIQDTPLIYSVITLFIAFVGPGKISLDYRLFSKK